MEVNLRNALCIVALFVGVLGCGCSSHNASASSAPSSVSDSPPTVEPTGIHVAAATTLRHNGALTVIKQGASVGGVVIAGAKSFGKLVVALPLRGARRHRMVS